MQSSQRMAVIGAIVILMMVWAALMPPFFTHGACDAEFDEVSARLEQDRKFLTSPVLAAAYFWRSRELPVRSISAAQCRSSKPWFTASCGSGDLLYVEVPVHNTVCRVYRDSEIKIQLQYDENARLRSLQSDMKPYRYLHLPGLGINWDWGK